jgi:hypothetical protein
LLLWHCEAPCSVAHSASGRHGPTGCHRGGNATQQRSAKLRKITAASLTHSAASSASTSARDCLSRGRSAQGRCNSLGHARKHASSLAGRPSHAATASNQAGSVGYYALIGALGRREAKAIKSARSQLLQRLHLWRPYRLQQGANGLSAQLGKPCKALDSIASGQPNLSRDAADAFAGLHGCGLRALHAPRLVNCVSQRTGCSHVAGLVGVYKRVLQFC